MCVEDARSAYYDSSFSFTKWASTAQGFLARQLAGSGENEGLQPEDDCLALLDSHDNAE